MFTPYFKDAMCIPSKDALKDMIKNNVPPDLVQFIIEMGEDYINIKKSKNEVVRCIGAGRKLIFVKLVPSYSYSLKEEVWLIKHIGVKRR